MQSIFILSKISTGFALRSESTDFALVLQNSKRLKKDENEGKFELVFSFVELQAGTLVFGVRLALN